jgi:multidrug efflux system membrane fusion protein
MVEAGDPLVQIDDRPYQNALRQANGQLIHDQALLENAKVDLERYRNLVKQNSLPRQQLDTQEALVHQYEGTLQIDSAQCQVTLWRALIHFRCKIARLVSCFDRRHKTR